MRRQSEIEIKEQAKRVIHAMLKVAEKNGTFFDYNNACEKLGYSAYYVRQIIINSERLNDIYMRLPSKKPNSKKGKKVYDEKYYQEILDEVLAAMEEGTLHIPTYAKEKGHAESFIRGIIKSSPKGKKAWEDYKRSGRNIKARPANKKRQKTSKSNSESDSEPFVKKQVTKIFDERSGVITTKSLDIKTVDDLLLVAEVDLKKWEVERHVINSWEVTVGSRNTGTDACETYTNFQVKVWLKKKSSEVKALEELYERIAQKSPIVPRIKISLPKLKSHQRELEISLFDIHLGLRCFKPAAEQTSTPEYVEEMTILILEKLIQDTKIHGPFEQIIFPMGNDFLHTDNCYNTTTAGTYQPEGDAWKSTFLRGEALGLAIIDRLLKEAPVKVISIPGNHSGHSEFALGRIVNAAYRHNDNIIVDATLAPYKFHHYGRNLLGFEHGHSIRQQLRLAGIMANENRLNGVWEEARYCEWHLGDQHRKGSAKPMHFEELGVSVEFLPGLTPPNEWHKLHAFCWQKRAGMAFIWDKSTGPLARFQINVDNYTNKLLK